MGGGHESGMADGATPWMPMRGNAKGHPANTPQPESNDRQTQVPEMRRLALGEFPLAVATLAKADTKNVVIPPLSRGLRRRHTDNYLYRGCEVNSRNVTNTLARGTFLPIIIRFRRQGRNEMMQERSIGQTAFSLAGRRRRRRKPAQRAPSWRRSCRVSP